MNDKNSYKKRDEFVEKANLMYKDKIKEKRKKTCRTSSPFLSACQSKSAVATTQMLCRMISMWDPASMVIKKTINSPRGRRATSNFGIAAGCRLGPVVAGGKCTPIAEYCRISDWTQLKR
ncbi:hypothetical protein PV325_009522 [Microctonus aethiopoides]|nr:hypothetical protein PV325_009522 [Microctonus aethiopoides]KAK0094720.1 hypothetical protein PV326_010209 [Microctonus aethiopoides]